MESGLQQQDEQSAASDLEDELSADEVPEGEESDIEHSQSEVTMN